MNDIQKDAKKQLAEYKKVIDDDIAAYSEVLLKECLEEYNQTTFDIVKAYTDVLSRGGKRLRGALTMHAYFMAGGKDKKLAMKAARCIEMIHAYLLIIDDIADCSETRRGGLAAHTLLTKHHQDHSLHGDAAHFGSSQAMHAALFGSHTAMEEITKLNVGDKQKIELMKHLNDSLTTTIAGQVSDIYNEALREVSEEDVRQVLTWKTAYYSFLNPLQFGLFLADKDMREYEWLHKYAIHVGLSFQITDDILGIFADEGESGKSTLDDLREGKVTLLVARTLSKANRVQKKEFLTIFGKQNITRKEQQVVKDIMRQTGAFESTKEVAEDESVKAVFSLSEAPVKLQKYVRFFDGIAVYITQRRS